MTFNDYVMECELYDYSAECFDMLKEATELDLMLKYLENQSFLAEYAEDLEDEGYTFTEGYFMESNGIDEAAQKASTKSKSLFKSIGDRFMRVIGVVVNFFKKLFSKKAPAEPLPTSVRKSANSEEGKAAIKDAIESAWDSSWNKLFTLSPNGELNVDSVLRSLETNQFTIYPAGNKSGKLDKDTLISVEDFNDLVEAAAKIADRGKVRSMGSKIHAGKTLKKCIKTSKITIDLDKNSVDSVADKLEKGKNILDQMFSKILGGNINESTEVYEENKTAKKTGAEGIRGEYYKSNQQNRKTANRLNRTQRKLEEHRAKEDKKNGTVTGEFDDSDSKETKLANHGQIEPYSKIDTYKGRGESDNNLGSQVLKMLGLVGLSTVIGAGALTSIFSNPAVTNIPPEAVTNASMAGKIFQMIGNHIWALVALGAIFTVGMGVAGFKIHNFKVLVKDLSFSINTITKNIILVYQRLNSFRNKAISNIKRLNLTTD